MTRRNPKTRAGLLIAVVTSASLAIASLVAVVAAAPAAAAPADHLVFTTQPGGAATGGIAFPVQPIVEARDGSNVTDPAYVGMVTLAIATGTPGATLACTANPKAAVAGVATFAGCNIDKAGNYTLTASATGLTAATSTPAFTVSVGPALKLGFTTQPGNGQPAQNLTAQPVVAAQDAGGNTVVGSLPTVTLAITPTTPVTGGPGTLTCTTNPVIAVAGVATFAGCKIDLAGTGYKLRATSTAPVLTLVDSLAFNVGAFHLTFSMQPNGGAGGAVWTQQPKVEVRDAANAVVATSTASIALTITQFTPATGGPGTLTCTTNPVIAVAGVATFAGCKINTGGTSYRLTATDAVDGLSVASATFNIVGPTALPQRIFGVDAIATSIAVSQREFPIGLASAVVLARSDFFSDALAGGPLAANRNAPLLITPGTPVTSTLDPRVTTEIQRVLVGGGTVFILGGPLAVATGIDTALAGLGYIVVRVQGPNLYATAVAIAGQLGNPTTIFEATGLNFADALSAVPAAIDAGGAILLTNGTTQAPETATYLAEHPPVLRYAIGGPLAAAGADPLAIPVFGEDLFGTSAAVAARFYAAAALYGVATGLNFPDALSGGVFMATGGRHGPMLLVNTNAPLPPSIFAYLALQAPGTPGVVFGGPIAVADDVLLALAAAVG